MPPPTHFLCIPIHYSPQLATSLASFRADVTSPLHFGFPEDAVRPLGTMHLTLGVMTLMSAENSFEAPPLRSGEGGEAEKKRPTLAQALDVLKRIKLNELLKDARCKTIETNELAPGDGGHKSKDGEEPLKITLKGLRSIGSADKASVLYAPPVDPEGILYRFCKTLRQTFQDAGIMDTDSRPLLLHATVLNTIYVRQWPGNSRGLRGRGRGSGREKLTIDARQVVDRYEGYGWMEDWSVTGVDLCRIGARKGDDGEEKYIIEGTVEF